MSGSAGIAMSARGPPIQFALIGNNVLIHPGCSIGQDGYGFVFFGPDGHLKVPQTGRVLIQNDVEIGAGTTIDRGSLRDTVIGEGTKIDNQVQIGHNVTIGRHCLLAAQIGLGGQPDDWRQCGAGRQGGDQQPSSHRRRRPGHGDERASRTTFRPAGAGAASLQSRPGSGSGRSSRWSVWCATARPIRRARGGSDGGGSGQI